MNSNHNSISNYIALNSQNIHIETLTLKEWLERWINLYSIRIKENTISSYKEAINNHIVRVLGNYRLIDINSELLQLFYNSLHIGIDIDKALSSKSIHNIHGVLHKSLETAVGYGYLDSNPADMVLLPKQSKKVIRPMNNVQVKNFLESNYNSIYYDTFLFALFTGMRQSEIIGLTWDCIDFESRTILVNKQLVKMKKTGEFKFAPCKSSKERYIKPAEFIFELLMKIKHKQENDIFIKNNTWQGKKFVFINEKGEHLTQSGVYNAFKKSVRKIGLETFRFHDLRHTYAVLSIQAGDDFKTLQYNMGHYSAAFTLDTYGFCLDLMKIESANRMQNFYSSKFC